MSGGRKWAANRHFASFSPDDVGEKLDILSVIWGVPRYLQEIRPALSANENIRRLCFTPGGLLFREFDELFAEIFGAKSMRKRAVLLALAAGSKSVAEKVSRLRVARGVSVRTALVYEGNLSPSVKEEGFFDYLVPSSDLFRMERTARLMGS